MRQLLLTSILVISAWQAAAEPTAITAMAMGDGVVNGKHLDAYEHTWMQCALAEGNWTNMGPMTEILTVIGPLARHTQFSEQPDGQASTSTTYFDHQTLAPFYMEQRVLNADGAELVKVVRRLGEDGYEGFAQQGSLSKSLSGVVSSRMWHGGALGLPLVTIDPGLFPIRFASSMIGFDGTYKTIATLAGEEEIAIGAVSATARLIDVEWHHNESGDVYAPGPDGSGGRFWVVENPPPGMPYVPQYQTDSYLVTALKDTCPGS